MSQTAASPAADSQLLSLKVPPHSVEAEQSVLGGLLLDNTAWDRIGDALDVDDFYRDDHRRIFRHIAKLIDQSKPADVVTVAESIASSADKDKTGGLTYLGALAQNTPSAHNIRRYAEIVHERAIMRKLAAVGTEIADSALNPIGQGRRPISRRSRVESVSDRRGWCARRGGLSRHPSTALAGRWSEWISCTAGKTRATSPAFRPDFGTWISMTSGMQQGDLVIVAGRPSMGKTAFALNMGEHVAVDLKQPVAVFSMEMSGTQIAARMLGSLARIDQHKLRTGGSPMRTGTGSAMVSASCTTRRSMSMRPARSIRSSCAPARAGSPVSTASSDW